MSDVGAGALATAGAVTEPILLRRDHGGVARLTLNRPGAFNALSRAMLARLQAELDAIAGDRRTRVVVIAGGEKAFSAGHDLKEIGRERDREALTELFAACSRAMLAITRLPQPVIALVDGIATAAGCQLVAACDLAIASTRAGFATSGIKYGLFCSTPMVALARNVPRKPAMEMLLTGDLIEAREAHRLGLVNYVAKPEALEAALESLLGRLLDKPAAVLAEGKRAFYRQQEMGLEEAYAFTTEVIVDNALQQDFATGLDAFVAKRRPVFDVGDRSLPAFDRD